MRVPADIDAEAEVIGCAVGCERGAELAWQRLDAEDFYLPSHARLFAVLEQLDGLGGGFDGEERRIVRASELALVDESHVRAVVLNRSVMSDESGSFARRVSVAAGRWRAMLSLAAARDAIGDGADLELVRPLLEWVVA